MTNKEYADELHDLILRPDFQPKDGNTFCNFFVQEVAHLFGYNGFDKLMANDIVDLMEQKDKLFLKLLSPVQYELIAKLITKSPSLIIAGQKMKGHGHICVVSPLGEISYSAKWAKYVCNVANVGKTCFDNKGLNWAFATEPTLYLYRG